MIRSPFPAVLLASIASKGSKKCVYSAPLKVLAVIALKC